MQYARKIGASALVVAAAFAVAFAVLVSSTAEATIETRSATGVYSTSGDATGTAENGDTVYIRAGNTGFVLFEITSIGGASASFTHADASDDGQTLYCQANTTTDTPTCDVDVDDDSGVTVAVKIDEDAGKGAVFVKQTVVGTTTTSTDQITVGVAQVPTTLTAKLVSTSIDSGQGSDPGRTLLNIRLTDADGAGIAGERLTVVSTRALLSAPNTTDDGAAALERTVSGETTTLETFSSGDVGTLAGTVDTSEDAATDADPDVDTRGYARVAVEGGGAAGVSTITVTVGELTQTVDLVLHGPVKTISAAAEQSAIAVGGSTYIVVTALDSAGNPVEGQNVSVKTRGGVSGPDKLSVKVTATNTAIKDAPPAIGGTTAGTGDLPACGTPTARTDDTETDGVDESTFWNGSGTNDDGQCVILVQAPNPEGTTSDAARGTHTITLVANATGGDSPKGVDEVAVEIEVGGAPTTIESDAPERIDPSAEVTINVTVRDDESVRVGAVAIEAIHTAGDGAIITPLRAMTSDGRGKFTYLAPSTPGVTEFLVRTKSGTGAVTAQLPIIIQIGEEVVEEPEPVVEEEPEPVAGTLAPAPAGAVTLTSFSGGSVDDLAAALSECGSDVVAHASVGGGWVSYIPGAVIAAANAPFNAAFADGIPGPTLFQVTNCVDAMDDGMDGGMEETGNGMEDTGNGS
ncbi:MAG: hypothetical protein OXF01_14425 [Gemmatimonadetes bacterium]|nr:hypothetical protein [Gemmatimonadota bacterium]